MFSSSYIWGSIPSMHNDIPSSRRTSNESCKTVPEVHHHKHTSSSANFINNTISGSDGDNDNEQDNYGDDPNGTPYKIRSQSLINFEKYTTSRQISCSGSESNNETFLDNIHETVFSPEKLKNNNNNININNNFNNNEIHETNNNHHNHNNHINIIPLKSNNIKKRRNSLNEWLQVEKKSSKSSVHPMNNKHNDYTNTWLGASIALKDAFGPQLSTDSLPPTIDTPLPPPITLDDDDDLGELKDDQRTNSDANETSDGDLDPESLYFRDGKRKIDMVLVYEEEDLGVMTEAESRRRDQRKIFQENLIKEGLELEIEPKDISFDGKSVFVKIHIPWKTKQRYAEVMNMKLPVKRFITISVKAWDDDKNVNSVTSRFQFFKKWHDYLLNLFHYDFSLIPEEPSFYSETTGDREEQFIVKDRVTSFTSAQRSMIVMQILLRTKYDETDKVGVRRLLNDGAYLACFPLHEGAYNHPDSNGTILDRHVLNANLRLLWFSHGCRCQNWTKMKWDHTGSISFQINKESSKSVHPVESFELLYLEWARASKWYKKQPLCLIRKYFGDKIALYFCWLGFYTKMLYYPAIVGSLCFLYGLLSMESDDNIPSKEICDKTGPGNITLCPLCDKACDYQQLSDSCMFARLTYLFDNPATVFFAIFMSFWATTFLELWKRKQRVIVWEWDLQGIEEEEESRPEFETSVKTFRTNPVTREKEPYLPTWSRALRFFATGSAVLFMICVVLGAVLGTIIYRLSLVSVIYGGGGHFLRKHTKIFTSITAALINLIVIMILTRIYHKLALWLTNLENPRTQTEYEDSYTFKIFIFEFMNFYSSLIYIAFFKGRFFDYPGDETSRHNEFLRLKGDICDPAGCLSELCIQLAIIMIGKQTINNVLEIFYPKMWNWWRQRTHRSHTKDLSKKHTRWEEDYHLQDPGRLALFDEYLEMILQYGFVTLFVAAFPLAPLFALLNNIAEIRLDAYKMVTQARRPLAERVTDIGAWYGILKVITYAAVVFNAFVIAYTSDFIPRMVYKYKYSENFDLVGYIDASLSVFNTSHYTADMGADGDDDPPTCQYRGYRNGPDDENKYDLSPQYWHVFAARLAFVVVFEHLVFAITGIMQYVIPDIPSELKTQISREQLLAKEAKYEHGLKRRDDSEEILNILKDNNSIKSHAFRGSWARRLSKLSDGLDAHVEVTTKQRNSVGSTVWEVL